MLKKFLWGYDPTILATIALICGVASNVYCETLQFPQVNGDGTIFVGPFSYRIRLPIVEDDYSFKSGESDYPEWYSTSCRSYRSLGDNYEFDSKARMAMVFGIFAAIVGGFATVYSIVLACSGYRSEPRSTKCLSMTFFVTCLFQSLSLLIKGSSLCDNNPVMQYRGEDQGGEGLAVMFNFAEECEWAAGYRLNIASVTFWILAGLSMMYMKAPNFSASYTEPQSQSVTYQQNPDGTASVTIVTVVTGTVIPPPPLSKGM